MRRLKQFATLSAFTPLLFVLGNVSAAQVVSRPVPLDGDAACTSPATVTVTVFLKNSNAVIPYAVVLLRNVAGKRLQLELQTDANGRATASVPCGYLDVFATGYGFAPNAKRLMVEKDHQFLAISLEAFPMIDY